jgi:hypothetical protein
MATKAKKLAYAKFTVCKAHCRTIDGQLYMLEPLLSGIVTLPVDKDTKASVRRGWLKSVE